VNRQFWKINSAKDSNLTCYSSHNQYHIPLLCNNPWAISLRIVVTSEYFFLEFMPSRISQISSSIADAKRFQTGRLTLVCHFSWLYRWLKEETRVVRNYIRDVINYLKKGFYLERCIFLVPCLGNFQGQIPLRGGNKRKEN